MITKRILLAAGLIIVGIGSGLLVRFLVNLTNNLHDATPVNSIQSNKTENVAESNGVKFSIIHDDINGNINIEVEATDGGDRMRIVFPPYIFIYSAPNLLAYTQEDFLHVYLFKSSGAGKINEESLTSGKIDVAFANLITLDDYDTEFFPGSEFWAAFSLARGSFNAYQRGGLINGQNSITSLIDNGQTINVKIVDLQDKDVDVRIPSDAVPFRDIVAYFFKKESVIPNLRITRSGDDSRVDEIYQRYIKASISAESLRDVELPSGNMFAD